MRIHYNLFYISIQFYTPTISPQKSPRVIPARRQVHPLPSLGRSAVILFHEEVAVRRLDGLAVAGESGLF